ncbi:MAG: hydrogenase maturation nickel metallochaperone HypA [Candidatus Bathyarchaeota archaeon]
MHEYYVTKQIVDILLEEAKKHNAKKVSEVHLVIGKLSCLGIEQIKFYYEMLTEGTIMEGSKLHIEEEEVEVKCESCGYDGEIKREKMSLYHFLLPVLSCPKCSKEVKVVKGKECSIKSMKVVI